VEKDLKIENNAKSKNDNKLEIILISDIHLGPNTSTRPGEEAPDLLDKFINKCNLQFQPDFVIELGDRVNNFSHEVDLESTSVVKEKFKKIKFKKIHILGNHDLHFLTVEENQKLFGNNICNSATIINGYKLITLNSQDPVIEGVGGHIGEKQLNWLETELKKDSIPTILLCHHPIDDQSISENPHFIKFPTFAFVENKSNISQVINKFPNIIAFINGHVHWINTSVNRFPYISVPSFIEAWPEKSSAPGMFTKITIKKNSFIESTFYSLNPEKIIGKFTWTK